MKVEGPGHEPSRPRPSATTVRRPVWPLLLAFTALALAWTWPLATRLATRIAHDPGDPILNTWILWWNAQALPFSEAWWNAPVFYPMPGAFALSEHLAGIGIFTAPLAVAGVNAIAAYNVALIAACALSGFFTGLLARHLTGSTLAGIVAGIAFAFGPYRGGQLAHLQVLNAQWMPLALLAMHQYLSGGSWRWLAVMAAAWVLQALSNGYYLLFFPVLAALWFAWFGTAHANAADRRRWRAFEMMATLAAASVPLVPVLLRYKAVHDTLGITRSQEEMVRFSASPESLLHASPLLAFWPAAQALTQEGYLLVGLTVTVLVAIALLMGVRVPGLRQLGASRSPVLFYPVAAVIMYWLAMGPALEGGLAALARPYTMLTALPGYEGLRAPARFAMLGSLCLAVGAAFGAAWIERWPIRRRAMVLAFVFAGLFVDGWIERLPLVPPPQRIMLPKVNNAVVLELPAYDINVNLGAMYRSMAHGSPLVNGFSGHTPLHYTALNTAMLRQDPSVLWWLARGRPLLVVVHRRLDSDGAMRAYVEGAGGVLREESGVGPVFLVPPRALDRELPPSEPLAGVKTDQPSPAVTVADLGGERVVRLLSFAAKWRHADIPERMTVEVSSDGSSWTTVWENWTGALIVSAAIEDQREVPVRIPMLDARARYVRLQPSPRWLPRELRVHTP